MKKEIVKIVKNALLEAKNEQNWTDFGEIEVLVEYTKNEQFGDYTTNIAMILAKKIGKSPMEIAEILKDAICHSGLDPESMQIPESSPGQALNQVQDDTLGIFEKIDVAAPGYINFYLSQKYLQSIVLKINTEKENFGTLAAKKEKVMVEYSQPNTHKEFHIGHLRNVFIGSSLINVLRKSGFEVTSANYIGDTGTHIAKCLWGIVKFHGDEDLDKIENKAEFLGKVYAEAVRAIADNSEFEEEFKKLQKDFESGDVKLVELWQKTKQWSLDEFQEIYDVLGAKFDVYFWESEEEEAGKSLLPQLLKTKNIEESQGAIIANLEEYGLGVLVLVRKDGSALYGLKDLPLAVKKFEQFNVDKSIVVVDLRQGLYFKQIFKILELMGFDKDMSHVGYEFVSLKGSETMSSRKGNIIPAKFLMDEVVAKVKEKFPKTEAAQKIAMGALKFYMLKYSGQSKIEYDIDESVRLEGATGPYVQYAHARICSILEKADWKNENANLDLLVHERELSLIKELDKFPQLVEEIAESFEVHKFAHYAIKLADKFHSFYDACRVIDEENPELTNARLFLVNAVRITLAETLRLIGVEAPEKM
jgi:arginyl-tRNA synthetase